MIKEKDKNWIGISDRPQLVKVFTEYLSLRLPIKASQENWPINNQTNLSMIVIYNVFKTKSVDYFKLESLLSHSRSHKLEKLLTDDQLKIGIRICMEIEIAGLSRLELYHERSGMKIMVKEMEEVNI